MKSNFIILKIITDNKKNSKTNLQHRKKSIFANG